MDPPDRRVSPTITDVWAPHCATILPVPTRFLDDSTPIVQFDPQLEVSPFILFRRLKEGRPPLLVDVRPEPGALTIAGAIPYPGPDWSPPEGEDVILFDDDGATAVEGARHMQAAGWPRV